MIYVADYELAAKKAIEVLEDSDITQAPILLMKIIERYSGEIRLVSYTKVANKNGMFTPEVADMFDSELGSCAFDPIQNHYIIYYNDSLSPALKRFTVAHELGHIFLEHHQKSGVNNLHRLFVPEEDYKEYEKEANVFARNLLSPAPLAKIVVEDEKDDFMRCYHIQSAFQITESASGVRLRYIYRDLRDYNEEMKSFVNSISLLYQTKCYECNTVVPQHAKYCITCGKKRITKSIYHDDLPPEVEYDSNGRFIHCVQCGNEEHNPSAFYCKICGAPLMNLCLRGGKSSVSLPHRNPSNALFCGACGEITVFNKYKVRFTEEVPVMKYIDGVDYNPETMQVLRCPKCSNEEFGENAQYCRICGTDLYNRCEGAPFSSFDNFVEYDNKHANPSNARFCEVCGRPTIYNKTGILVDYTEYSDPEPFQTVSHEGFVSEPNPFDDGFDDSTF